MNRPLVLLEQEFRGKMSLKPDKDFVFTTGTKGGTTTAAYARN